MSAADEREVIQMLATDERTLSCPLCDWTEDVPPVPRVDAIGEALGISGSTLQMVHAEQVAKGSVRSALIHLEGHDVMDWLRLIARTRLMPVESIALTAALGPIKRGEEPGENTALMCVLALARITGRHDWSQQ